jgi:L-fuculose-phosphate aldolase
MLLEWACSVYWRAAALGTPRVLDQEQLDDVVRSFVERGYGKKQVEGGG